MSKAPAFQTYAADYYMDTAHWTVEEVGIYQRLLLFEWVNGPLPNDQIRLARIAGCSTKKFQKGWTTISIKFIPFGTCQLQNKRLEQTREIQHKYSESRKDNANKRWKGNNAHAYAHAEDMQCTDHALLSSSSSSIQKKESIKKEKPRKQPLTDEQYFEVLKSNPAYKGIDIDREKGKCEAWCLTANKMFSRRRFVNWLNRVEKPMQVFTKSTYAPPEPPVMHEHEAYDPEKIARVRNIVEELGKTMEVK